MADVENILGVKPPQGDISEQGARKFPTNSDEILRQLTARKIDPVY